MVLLSPVLIYFAIYFGGMVHGYMVGHLYEFSFLMIGLFSYIVAALAWALFVIFFLDFDKTMPPNLKDTAVLLLVGPTFLGYIYGLLANPFATFGFAPWNWLTLWNILLILTLLPALFAFWGLIAEASVSDKLDTQPK